jgi:hypothetical protein
MTTKKNVPLACGGEKNLRRGHERRGEREKFTGSDAHAIFLKQNGCSIMVQS